MATDDFDLFYFRSLHLSLYYLLLEFLPHLGFHVGFWFACWIVSSDCLQWQDFTACDSIVRTRLFWDAFVLGLISVALWNPALQFLVTTFSKINRLSVTCRYLATSLHSSKKPLYACQFCVVWEMAGRLRVFLAQHRTGWARSSLHAGTCPVIESETAAPGSLDEDSQLDLRRQTSQHRNLNNMKCFLFMCTLFMLLTRYKTHHCWYISCQWGGICLFVRDCFAFRLSFMWLRGVSSPWKNKQTKKHHAHRTSCALQMWLG